MRERLAEERIIKAIKCHGTGDKFSYLNRELMISTGTVYTRFSKYLGLEVNQVKRLKGFELENNKLKPSC